MLIIDNLKSSIFKRADNNFNLRRHVQMLLSYIREHFLAIQIINVWNCLPPSTDLTNCDAFIGSIDTVICVGF